MFNVHWRLQVPEGSSVTGFAIISVFKSFNFVEAVEEEEEEAALFGSFCKSFGRKRS